MKTTTEKVTIKLGEGTNEKTFVQEYQKVAFENAADVLSALEQGAEAIKELLQDLNYGRDLKVRQKVRQSILDKEAGPEKAIQKLAKDLVKMFAAMGKTLTEEKALERARKQFAEAQAEEAA